MCAISLHSIHIIVQHTNMYNLFLFYYYSVESMDIQNDFSRNSSIYTGHNVIVNPLGKKIETTEL